LADERLEAGSETNLFVAGWDDDGELDEGFWLRLRKDGSGDRFSSPIAPVDWS
jgi:hypothetical protein